MNRWSRVGPLVVSVSLLLAACSGGPTSDGSGTDDYGPNQGAGPKSPGSSGKPGAASPNKPGAPNSPADPTKPTTPSTIDPASDPKALPDGNVSTVPANCTGSGVNGNGAITRTTRTAAGFTDVMSEFSGDVVIQEGSQFRVQIETDSNLQTFVTTGVQNGAIVLSTKPNTSLCFNFLRVIVTLPSLRAATLGGSGAVAFAKTSAASDVQLTSTGAGEIRFSGKAKSLSLDLSGAGSIHLASGSATSTSVRLSGAGSIDASAFAPGAVTKNVSGAGSVSF